MKTIKAIIGMLTVAFILTMVAFFNQVNAQTVELFPKQDTKSTSAYIQASSNNAGGGFEFLGITSGIEYNRKFGLPGLYITAQATPVVVEAFGIQLIGGLKGSAGYFIEATTGTDANWGAVYGLRIPKYSIEITRQHIYHYGPDYVVPVSVRFYIK